MLQVFIDSKAKLSHLCRLYTQRDRLMRLRQNHHHLLSGLLGFRYFRHSDLHTNNTDTAIHTVSATVN